jgi:hypothetical protein
VCTKEFSVLEEDGSLGGPTNINFKLRKMSDGVNVTLILDTQLIKTECRSGETLNQKTMNMNSIAY